MGREAGITHTQPEKFTRTINNLMAQHSKKLKIKLVFLCLDCKRDFCFLWVFLFEIKASKKDKVGNPADIKEDGNHFIPETTLRPGVLGLELTSRTSVSSEVLPTPEQLSSSCRRSSCFRSGVSAHHTRRFKVSLDFRTHSFLSLIKTHIYHEP